MSIPLAVSPSVKTPGVYVSVNLLAGTASPGGSPLRVALLAPLNTDGTGTANVPTAGGGVDTAAAHFGVGSMGHLAAKQLYGRYEQALVDFVAVTSGVGAAALVLTFSGSPSSNTSVNFDIMGREFNVPWLSAEAATAMATRVVAAVNQRGDDLMVTASDTGGGAVTLTAKTLGNAGNDVRVKAALAQSQTNNEAVAGATTYTALAGGSSDPDFTTALAAITGKEYAAILPCLSNTDIANTATLNNFGRTVAHINSLNSGLDAKLQQAFGAITTTIAAGVASTVSANSANNDPVGSIICCINGRGLPCELAALDVGDWLAKSVIDPAANRIGDDYSTYIGSGDIEADRPTTAESEQALNAGLSLMSYTANGSEVLVRSITTHSQTATGAPDARLLDTQNVTGTYVVVRDVRDNLPLEFPNAKITPDTPEGADLPPRGVIEERDIKAWIATRMRAWVDLGVVTRASLDAALADGTLIVRVNSSDPTQVDIVIPMSIVPALAKFGVVANRVPN